MKDKVDVDRVIARLHNFILYGSKLSVKVVRKSYVWKGNDAGRHQTPRVELPGKWIEDCKIVKQSTAEAHSERENIKRITEHMENEDLWKLRRCLVGTMETICSEVFSDVKPWSEQTSYNERATWQVRRIAEMIELEVGDKVFLVYVKELGFVDGTSYPLCNTWNGDKGKLRTKRN
ncbi:hypothetical protein V6N13_092873 [Hibiscus sabdariffa]